MGDIVVDPLIKVVKSPQANEKAFKVLKGIGDQAVNKALEELFEWFLQGAETCKDAARALSDVGPPAVDGLLTLLKDSRLDQLCSTKGSMCLILAYNMEKIPHYNALLKKLAAHVEKSISLRGLSAGVLGKIADPRVVDPLIDVLKAEDDLTRWLAAGALFSIGEVRTAESLVTTLSDEDLFVTVTGSVWILIGDGLTLKPLLSDCYSENIEVKQKAVETLKKLGWKKQ